MSGTKLSRRELEQRFRADLILDAAEEVFAEHGFQGTAMEEIARRAELSVGSLYNVFPSKDALLGGVVERRQEAFMTGIAQAADGESTASGKLDAIVDFTFDYFQTHQLLFQLYLGATSGLLWHVRSTLGERTFQRHLSFLRTIAGVVRSGIRADGWPPTDADSAAWVIVAMLNAFLTRWIVSGEESLLATGKREARTFIRRILAIQPPPSAKPPLGSRERKR